MAYSFSRRDQLARQDGWRSYGHKRGALEEAKKLEFYDPQVRARFLDVARGFSAPRIGRAQMRIWIAGVRALIAGDHETADALGAQLPTPIRLEPERPESVFWYHR